MLWEISVTAKHLMKKASFVLLNFTKSTSKFDVDGNLAEHVREFATFARIRPH